MLEGMDRERLLELHLRVSTLLVELFQQPRVSPRTRKNMLRVVGGQVGFETIDPHVRAKASELIELAAQSDDDELRTLAEKIKTDRARRAR
jgi:hypothetical protein